VNLPFGAARPRKLTHAQTILYEIDMLRFSAANLSVALEWKSWQDLECFLLHFRSLIEFFGKPKPRRDNLSVFRPETIWEHAETRPSTDKLNRLHREDLWKKHEVRGPRQINDKISRYLQHCTELRVQNKSWDVREMYEEISPVIADFEKLLPNQHRPWGEPPLTSEHVSLLSSNAQGTATRS
jgi:hypothetical protein